MDKRRVFRSKAEAYSGGPQWPREIFTLLLEKSGFDPTDKQAIKNLVAVDVGAGTGNTAFPLADLGCTVIAVEPNKPMLEKLIALKAAGGYDNVIPTDGDAMDLKIPDEYMGRADLIYAANAAHWWSSKIQGIAKGSERRAAAAWGVAGRPDAKVAIVYLRPQERDPFVKELHEIILRHFSTIRHIPTEATVKKVLSVEAFGDYFMRKDGKPAVLETYGDYDLAFRDFDVFKSWLLNLSYMPDNAFENEAAAADFRAFFDRACQRSSGLANVRQGLRLYTGPLNRAP